MKTWQPFPDTVAALKRLHRRYKLAIISNVDDQLFAGTAKLLEVPFDSVTTALEVRSYKPSFNNFHRVLEKVKVSKVRVLHVAESLHHDVEPARAFGIHSVWVNRRHGKQGAGATPVSSAAPDLQVPDLKTLADLAVGPKSEYGGDEGLTKECEMVGGCCQGKTVERRKKLCAAFYSALP